MKYRIIKYLIASILLVSLSNDMLSQKRTTPKTRTNSKTAGVNWLSISQVEALLKTSPKPVYVDAYTDWCYWCKVMEKKTFTHPKVIEYLNKHFYSIRLDAETPDSLTFKGQKYGRLANSKTNELAAKWMYNKLSYPTSIFFDSTFSAPQPVPGYLEVPTIEMILKYVAEKKNKTIPWEKFSKEFKSTWK